MDRIELTIGCGFGVKERNIFAHRNSNVYSDNEICLEWVASHRGKIKTKRININEHYIIGIEKRFDSAFNALVRLELEFYKK